MSLATLYSRAQNGIQAPLVSVEVHLSNGLPSLSIVGLPETEVKESKDRVRSAIINSNYEFPSRRITINLAPADLPKGGGRFDLAIALGILVASGQLEVSSLDTHEFIGELALSGVLRPIHGTLPIALQTREAQRGLILPEANADEAALVSHLSITPASSLLEVCAHLSGRQPVQPVSPEQVNNTATETGHADLSDVHGQAHAKRALQIAAAGSHNLLMIGPPGTGKTMLASRLPGILPPMTEQEALESAAIHSISQAGFKIHDWRKRPFRAPHHTASAVALVGGGSQPRPGEISLAHHGVLFLDELPEYNRHVLDVLREPLESGSITISRAARQAQYPSRFQFIAAMNPCPCGYLGDGSDRCHCTAEQIQRYRSRVSGPLLDRIDMHIEVPRLSQQQLREMRESNPVSSAEIRSRTIRARGIQLRRCNKANSQLENREIDAYCSLSADDMALLEKAIEKLGLSARAYHRILRVARTIADLGESENIITSHITEALTYRRLDRRGVSA